MTQDEFDKKAAELFTAIDKAAKNDDPRYKSEGDMVKIAATLAIEFAANQKRIVEQFEFLNKSLCVLIDLQAASYQNGIIVKIANEIELNTEGLEEDISTSESLKKGLEGESEEGKYAYQDVEDNKRDYTGEHSD